MEIESTTVAACTQGGKALNLITKYIILLTKYTDEDISASQFETKFLEMFKNELCVLPKEVYEILNYLFLDVDSYCSDLDLRDDNDLDDLALMFSAEEALQKLSSF